MRILVRPCYDDFLENKLFVSEHKFANHWLDPYVRLREIGLERGIEFATWDMYPLKSADAILFQDLPTWRQDLVRARESAPGAKFILQLLESPAGRPHWFVKQNHDLFDAILTYNNHLCDNVRYFHYDLPVGKPPAVAQTLSFAERKPLVMINTNLTVGFFGANRLDLSAIPGFRVARCGWKVRLRDLMNSTRGELYSRRRLLARTAEPDFPNLLDIYGRGWGGEPMNWPHRYLPNRPYHCAHGVLKDRSKLDVLATYRFAVAFENLEADVGYISEKLFDPLYAGAVPIYLGDAGIANRVASDCYIDARQFPNDRELLRFVKNCSEREWESYREAGVEFLKSPAMVNFRPQAFAENVIHVLLQVADGTGR